MTHVNADGQAPRCSVGMAKGTEGRGQAARGSVGVRRISGARSRRQPRPNLAPRAESEPVINPAEYSEPQPPHRFGNPSTHDFQVDPFEPGMPAGPDGVFPGTPYCVSGDTILNSRIGNTRGVPRITWCPPNQIEENIAERGGVVLPIEDRMLKSLEKTAAIAGVSLDSIDLADRSAWGGKSTYQKAEDIELDEAYLAVFGGMSHHVHGSWQDLYEYYITADGNGGFMPNFEWHRPRPQPIFALGIIVGDANKQYFRFVGGELATRELADKLGDLERRIRAADAAHEAFLAAKST
jgi:hypothetical protein